MFVDDNDCVGGAVAAAATDDDDDNDNGNSKQLGYDQKKWAFNTICCTTEQELRKQQKVTNKMTPGVEIKCIT